MIEEHAAEVLTHHTDNEQLSASKEAHGHQDCWHAHGELGVHNLVDNN